MKKYFLDIMDTIGDVIHTEKQRKGSFHFYSIGSFFRVAFRRYFIEFLKELPREIIHEAKMREYAAMGQVPALHNLI